MKQEQWDIEITPEKKRFELNLKEIIRYRDLLTLFVRRDIVSAYKQTVLGPVWLFIQPIFVSVTQFLVFGKIAKIPSDGVPYFLFVLAGNVLWSYFSACFNGVANTFSANQGLFGKVYFPRAITPLAITTSNLFKFSIQFLMFLGFLVYSISVGAHVRPNLYILFLPLIILAMALISMGLGMVITSLTTKYRDFNFLIGFGVTLFMYVTPVVYPTSLFIERAGSDYYWLIYANPLTGLFDLFKYAFLGEGVLNPFAIAWSGIFAVFIYLFGLLVFNKTEKSFMDTI